LLATSTINVAASDSLRMPHQTAAIIVVSAKAKSHPFEPPRIVSRSASAGQSNRSVG
jgi:hypothetical protein